MQITFLGHGNVGGALAAHMQRVGHRVTIATADVGSERLVRLRADSPAIAVAAPEPAVRSAELVVLATPFDAHEPVLTPLRQALAGKVLLDCTNPVGPGLTHGLGSQESGSERIQRLVPSARVVKTFSVYGFENFAQPPAAGHGLHPSMPLCGGDGPAKAEVAALLRQLGWEPLDVGGLDQALHLEHMTLLWIKMVRVGGHSPHTLWARLVG
jgi:hypothetical protein